MAKHHLSIAFFSTKVNPPRRTLPSRTNHQARAIDKTGRLQGRRNKGEGGTIATSLKILANQLALSHSGGRGDTTLLLSPPLDVQAFLRPWFVHSLAKQSYLTACT